MVAAGVEYFELFCELNEPNYFNMIYSWPALYTLSNSMHDDAFPNVLVALVCTQ